MMPNFLNLFLGKIRTVLGRINLFNRFRPSLEIYSSFFSKKLNRNIHFQVYLPPKYTLSRSQNFPLLVLNDGQDLEAVQFSHHLEELYRRQQIPPVIAVGIFAGNRMQEYGTAQYPDYKNRGDKAKAYSQFILKELIPFLEENYRLNEKRVIAGFSLGGLSAFDIAWNHSKTFQKAGIFSGSFWWRSEPFDPKDPDANRIAHFMVQKARRKKNLQFWFQTGTLDEEEDRNNNGIIDSIDDTRDLIADLSTLGFQEGKDIQYVEMVGGRHDTQTWGKIMPEFLKWAFG